jgi:hypothetical protein
MAMLKVYRGPSLEAEAAKSGFSKPDPAASGGTGSFGSDITPSKVGAPHKKGVKTLGQKMMKPKSVTSMAKSSTAKGY